MTVLGDCETILERRADAAGQTGEIKRKALDRIAVLSELAREACELAVEGDDGCAARAFRLAAQIDALVGGVDSVHALLRQAVPEADSVVRQMGEVKKGAYRSLSRDVLSAIDYTLPVSWACVPAMRVVVQVLRGLEEIAAAP